MRYAPVADDEYLTTEEAAKLLKLHPDTVRRLIREGKLPGIKIGGQYRIRRRDIDEKLK